MIAVIYRFKIKLGREDEYKRHWQNVANYFRQERGALGSCLHQGSDGLWYVYSIWPTKEVRDNAWPISKDMNLADDPNVVYIERELAQMKACVDEKLPDVQLDIVADKLTGPLSVSPVNEVVPTLCEVMA